MSANLTKTNTLERHPTAPAVEEMHTQAESHPAGHNASLFLSRSRTSEQVALHGRQVTGLRVSFFPYSANRINMLTNCNSGS
jgi:hypothetical protein